MYIIESPGSHVRRSSRRRVGCSSPSDDIYNCTELMDLVAGLCDWNSLVRLGNCNRHLRDIVQYIIRRRISLCLGRFIHRKHHARFFDLLEKTESAVVGGFVRHFMCLEDDVYSCVLPSQLSIVIPVGVSHGSNSGRRWVHFISNCGEYDGDWDEDTSFPYSTKSSKTIFFNQASSVCFYCSSTQLATDIIG
jgi:hypothetical protein